MSVEENKAIYRRMVDEVVNKGHFEVIPELFAEDYLDHNLPPGAQPGIGSVAMVFGMFRNGFSDLHFEIQEMVGSGDIVATRVSGSGTHDGNFMGTPPTGRKAEWGSMGFFRVRDGKIVEHWGQPDVFSLLQQLGVIPAGGPIT
jgi:steroid delta-isomerase-like uncharacterized protein